MAMEKTAMNGDNEYSAAINKVLDRVSERSRIFFRILLAESMQDDSGESPIDDYRSVVSLDHVLYWYHWHNPNVDYDNVFHIAVESLRELAQTYIEVGSPEDVCISALYEACEVDYERKKITIFFSDIIKHVVNFEGNCIEELKLYPYFVRE